MGETATEPKPRLRWYQYRLWHLFVLVTICAILCSWFACRMLKAERQRKAVKAINDMGAMVIYDYEYTSLDNPLLPGPPGPTWFRDLVGVDFVADVVEVSFSTMGVDLYPYEPSYGEVTDAWVQEHIPCLTRLETLRLHDTRVTEDGVKKLQEALPDCEICYRPLPARRRSH